MPGPSGDLEHGTRPQGAQFWVNTLWPQHQDAHALCSSAGFTFASDTSFQVYTYPSLTLQNPNSSGLRTDRRAKQVWLCPLACLERSLQIPSPGELIHKTGSSHTPQDYQKDEGGVCIEHWRTTVKGRLQS